MKKLFLILVLIFRATGCFAQDSVYVEGYYITRCLEKEISFKLKNDILRDQGKSYSTMIDYTVRPYYFTLRVNSKAELIEGELNYIYPTVCAVIDYQNIEVYEFNNESIRSFSKIRPYYIDPQNSEYVYDIRYIKGYAVRYIVENTNILEVAMRLSGANSPYTINGGIPYFYLYEFYQVEEIDGFSPPPGFELWEPNINVD